MKKLLPLILLTSIVQNFIYADLSKSLIDLKAQLNTLKHTFAGNGARDKRAPIIASKLLTNPEEILETKSTWLRAPLTPTVKEALNRVIDATKDVVENIEMFAAEIENFKKKASQGAVNRAELIPAINQFRKIIVDEQAMQDLANLKHKVQLTNQDKSAVEKLLTEIISINDQLEKYINKIVQYKEFQKTFKDKKDINIAAVILKRIKTPFSNNDENNKKFIREFIKDWELNLKI